MALDAVLALLKADVSGVAAVQPKQDKGPRCNGTDSGGVADVSAAPARPDSATAHAADVAVPFQPEAAPVLGCTFATAETSPKIKAGPLFGAAFAESVRCADCQHFQPGANPLRGRCGAGVTLGAPLAWHQRGARLAVGFGDPELWAADSRACESWLPHGLADAVHAMADRWGYSDTEREIAIEEATQHPAEWLRVIEADLHGRRWLGGGGWS